MSKRGRKKKFKLDFSSGILRSVFAVGLIVAAGLSAISFFASDYAVNDQIQSTLRSLLGLTAIFVPLILIVLAFMSFESYKTRFANPRILFGLIGVCISLAGLFHIIYGDNALEMAQGGYGGGFIGYQLSQLLRNTVSVYGGFLLLLAALIISVLVLLNTSLDAIFQKSSVLSTFLKEKLHIKLPIKKKDTANVDVLPLEAAIMNQQELHQAPVTQSIPAPSREEKKHKIEIVPSLSEPQNENVDSIIGNIDPNGAVGFAPSALPYTDRVWELPSLDLLNEPFPDNADRGDVKHREQVIINTLKSFGINAQMKGTSYGPTVTRYAIFAEQGTKITKIAALQYDLALALASPTGSVRIEAPMPGTHFIGIEVPNNTRTTVTFKEVFTSEPMKTSKTPLSIVLGKDVGGMPLISSIGKMPHLLVAGATGSGKSVFLHSIMFSLLYRCSPLECQFILIDPKRVELVHYQDIPHLKAPVITDIEKAPRALDWLVQEMERRYVLFESARARNIESYNEKSGFQAMSYIVVIIDELGEIMVADPSLVEKSIIRLAQLARATGIHLVLTTQRPSTNVVTGLIKANIPARIAFNVTSNTDSRVIIDQPGAEKLMGKGDMLYVPPDAAKPTRIQGVMVAEDEISRLVNYLKSTGFAPDYNPQIYEATNTHDGYHSGGSASSASEHDPLFDEAVDVVQSSGKASASYLQRRFSIGYSRAAKILDQLEEAGIIGPARGSKPREILISGADAHSPMDGFEEDENFPTAPQIDYENSRPNSFS